MADIWFTSDTHFGHANIIKYSNRPFANVDDMDEQLIQNWNKRVGKNDLVYHLGDFSFHKDFTKTTEIFNRLNGVKELILGNHDYMPVPNMNWHSVSHMRALKGFSQKVVLCHYAMRVWDQSHRGAIHLYGHSHGTLPGDSQSMDVGVDCTNYAPISYDEIKEKLKTQPQRQKEF